MMRIGELRIVVQFFYKFPAGEVCFRLGKPPVSINRTAYDPLELGKKRPTAAIYLLTQHGDAPIVGVWLTM